MRILLLVEAFNSLSQRVYAELTRDGHELAVEFDVHDAATEEGVALFGPDVVVAPISSGPYRAASGAAIRV